MFGFILGTVCLTALGVRFTRRRFGHRGGCHSEYGGGGHGWHGRAHGCGAGHEHDRDEGRGWGAHHEHDEGRGGFGGRERFSRGAQRWLFRQLQTTHGQETVIGEAFGEVTHTMDAVRAEAKKTREDVATAMRAELFDQATLDSAFARQNVQMEELQRVFGESLAKVHEVLDARQRGVLVELLERLGWLGHSRAGRGMGGAGPWGEGPYRG